VIKLHDRAGTVLPQALPVRQLATSIAPLLYGAPAGFSSARKICAKKRQLKFVQSAAAF
jgi:hypothetical protein